MLKYLAMKITFPFYLKITLALGVVVLATSAGFSSRGQKTLQLLVTSPTLETADSITYTNQAGVEERLGTQGLPWSISYPVSTTRDGVAAIGATKAGVGVGARFTFTWSMEGNVIRQETFVADSENLGAFRSIMIERE